MPPILKQSTVSTFSDKLIPSWDNRPLKYGFAYIPLVNKPYQNIGYYPQANDGEPSGTVTVLGAENEDPESPLLMHPVRYENIGVINNWNEMDDPTTPTYSLSAWAPIPPQGYVRLGMVATLEPVLSSANPPPLTAVVCLREDHAVQVANDKFEQLWHNVLHNNYVYKVPDTNVMAVSKGSVYPTVFVPKS